MLAKQLSVFLENKSGRLTEVTDVLGKAGINLSAMSIADNSDFGILRCIVSDPELGYKVLKEAHFTVKITNVIGFSCPNTPGSLAVVLKCLSDANVFIEYMYSFIIGHESRSAGIRGAGNRGTGIWSAGIRGRRGSGGSCFR